MEEVYTFDKTQEERLEDCNSVLRVKDIVLASEVQLIWSSYMEVSIDPIGWQAIWNIPRRRCNDLRIEYPNAVLVYVENVDFKELSAIVKVVAVQHDINIPMRIEASLVNLYPTKVQDEAIALNMETTANSLDMLRFFYNHIWWSFMIDYEDEAVDWPSTCLESRIQLYFDMKNGSIPRATAEHIRLLINEGNALFDQKQEIEDELDDTDDTKPPDTEKAEALMKIHLRLSQIRSELEFLEIPIFRSLVSKTHDKKWKDKYCLVFMQHSTVDDHIKYLNKIKNYVGTATVCSALSLRDVLMSGNGGEMIFIGAGTHQVQSSGALECGGHLIGVDKAECTILQPVFSKSVMFEFSAENVVIENVTINSEICPSAVLIRKGCVVFRNCIFYGNDSKSRQGLIALMGSKLVLENCELRSFSYAILGNSRVEIELNGCKIINCKVGLKIYDEADVKIDNCKIVNCDEYGVCVETSKNIKKIGDTDILKEFNNISVGNLHTEGNIKGNIAVVHQQNILASIESTSIAAPLE